MSIATLLDIIDDPAPPDRDTATTADGWLYDVATGEILNTLDNEGYILRDQFAVTDPESADWVMRRRADVEGEILKLDAQFAAIRKNYELRRNAQLRRLAFWDWRFRPSLIEWARSQLTGKARTWRGAFGSVAFRKTQGTNKILDDAAALLFVKIWEPSAVKVVESVNVKAVLVARERAEAATGEEIETPWLSRAEAGESVTVETGIEIEGVKQR